MNAINDFSLFAKDKGISRLNIERYFNSNMNCSYTNPMVLEERQMNVTSIDIYSRLLMERILFLGTDVTSESANILSAQLLWLEQQSDNDIQLYVNSPGGSVYDGLQLVDTMNYIKPDVATTCLGMSASMGAVIFTSGAKGKRSIIPHGRLLIHQPMGSTGNNTQCSDIQIVANEISNIKKELCKILSENSNLSIDEITEKSDRDWWLTSDEAIKYGFADLIIKKIKNINYV